MKRDECARNLAAGTYDLIVLDMLRDGPNYGYGIRKRIFSRSKGTLNWQDGTIYPVLRHLEKQGLVTSHWKGPTEGRQRLPRFTWLLLPASRRAVNGSGNSSAVSGPPSPAPSTPCLHRVDESLGS